MPELWTFGCQNYAHLNMKTRLNCSMRHCTCIATLNLATTLLLMAPAVSGADTVYVTAGGWMGDIFRIAPDGTRTVFEGFHTYSSEGVSGIALDGFGNVYAASYYGNTITRYSPTGAGTAFANTGIAYPQGITFDSAGNLYVAEYNANKIGRYASDGTRTEFAHDAGGGSTLYGPQDLAFDAAGNLFVANWGNSIVKFAPNGTSSIFAIAGLNHPGGLAFDAFGNLFVSNTGNNTILKYSPGGQVSVFASIGLNGPKDLAFDSSGNLYVVDSGNYAVDKFTPDGVKSILATTGSEAPWFIAIQPGLQVPEPLAATFLVLGSMSLAFAARKASNRTKAEPSRCSEPGADALVGNRKSVAPGR